MVTTLLTTGIACIIAAIVGGRLKAFGVEIPVLASGRRQVVLGVFGVALLGGAIALNGLPDSIRELTASKTPEKASDPAVKGCGPGWFSNVPSDRVTTIEAGSDGVEIFGADKPKNAPFVVVLNENSRMVGAVEFSAFESGRLFKISQIVNAGCETEENFRNSSRGGDKHVLQDYDDVEITLGSLKYSLRLGFASGAVEASLKRVG